MDANSNAGPVEMEHEGEECAPIWWTVVGQTDVRVSVFEENGDTYLEFVDGDKTQTAFIGSELIRYIYASQPLTLQEEKLVDTDRAEVWLEWRWHVDGWHLILSHEWVDPDAVTVILTDDQMIRMLEAVQQFENEDIPGQ